MVGRIVGRVAQRGDPRVRGRRRGIDELSRDMGGLELGLQARSIAFELLQPGVDQSVLQGRNDHEVDDQKGTDDDQ